MAPIDDRLEILLHACSLTPHVPGWTLSIEWTLSVERLKGVPNDPHRRLTPLSAPLFVNGAYGDGKGALPIDRGDVG